MSILTKIRIICFFARYFSRGMQSFVFFYNKKRSESFLKRIFLINLEQCKIWGYVLSEI